MRIQVYVWQFCIAKRINVFLYYHLHMFPSSFTAIFFFWLHCVFHGAGATIRKEHLKYAVSWFKRSGLIVKIQKVRQQNVSLKQTHTNIITVSNWTCFTAAVWSKCKHFITRWIFISQNGCLSEISVQTKNVSQVTGIQKWGKFICPETGIN